MPLERLRLDQLRPYNIAHAISHEDSPGHETLLRRAGHIRHADTDDQTHDGAEEADDGVACHRGRGSMIPCALPNHCAAGYDGEAAEEEEEETDVGDARGEVAG